MEPTFTITIESNTSLSDIDLLYNSLEKYKEMNCLVNLSIPKTLKKKEIGLIPLLLQFSNTWVRYENSNTMVLDIEEFTDENIETLYQNDLVFPLVSLVWTIKQIENQKGFPIKSHLKAHNAKYFNLMQALKPKKDWKLMLANFDHLPHDRGILNCFQVNNTFLEDRSQLSRNLKDSMDSILNFSSEAKFQYKRVSEYLMSILYELMKNTFEWGRTDESGVPLEVSVRGAFIQFHKKTRRKLKEEYKSFHGFHDYFSSETLIENDKEELYFLEISVFDSGIGFVKKYNSQRTENDQSALETIKTCFLKHSTSANGIYRSEKGIGLDQILTLLNKKGFVQIKTDKYFLYRNLISEPREISKSVGQRDMDFYDVKNNSKTPTEQKSYCSGSVVTVIYPLKFSENE